MRRSTACIAMALLLSSGVFGQAPAAFDVASIKPSLLGKAGGEGGERENISTAPGSLTMRNVSLHSCIQWAYSVRDFQISGPGWLNSERYDVTAKAAAPASDDQLRLMLQSLLQERFHMTVRRQEKELPVYALVVAKNGPKIHAAAGDSFSSVSIADGGFVFRNYSMRQLADRLSMRRFNVDRPVLDKTGLKGAFDFTLQFAASDTDMKHMFEGRQAGPSIFTLIQEQLGLRLEPQKDLTEAIVIERADRVPSEN